MNREDIIAQADAATAEGDRLDKQGMFLQAAKAHKQAAQLWHDVGSIIMPNSCLVDAENCERAYAGQQHYEALLNPALAVAPDTAAAEAEAARSGTKAILPIARRDSVADPGSGTIYYTTPSRRIGKHDWRLAVRESERGHGRVTEFQWRGINGAPWQPDTNWPTYNADDGMHAGCPRSLRKLWEDNREAVQAALKGEPAPMGDLFSEPPRTITAGPPARSRSPSVE